MKYIINTCFITSRFGNPKIAQLGSFVEQNGDFVWFPLSLSLSPLVRYFGWDAMKHHGKRSVTGAVRRNPNREALAQY